VYWRRRLTVVVVLALVLGAVWQTRVNRGGSTDLSAASQPGAAVSDRAEAAGLRGAGRFAAAAGVGATAGTSQDVAGRTPGAAVIRPVFATPVGRCEPTATSARADVQEPVVSGTGATLQVRLSTSATAACTLVLEDRLLVQVARDGEAIWRLRDCPSAVASDSVVLQPGWATVVDITWSGRTSNAKCGLDTPAAAPGTYALQAAILSGEPGTSQLDVLAAERPQRGRRSGRESG
jgi:hypothetical protein